MQAGRLTSAVSTGSERNKQVFITVRFQPGKKFEYSFSLCQNDQTACKKTLIDLMYDPHGQNRRFAVAVSSDKEDDALTGLNIFQLAPPRLQPSLQF
ncbi:MAG: hypothetical protein K0S58_2748 [Nitrospira sp.]|jgi:hypothetical protein|nr:hypothetical protein [Nitrospira sp.]